MKKLRKITAKSAKQIREMNAVFMMKKKKRKCGSITADRRIFVYLSRAWNRI